jgi:hypothetical protein
MGLSTSVAFRPRIREAGFEVEELTIPVGPRLKTMNTIWMARRSS